MSLYEDADYADKANDRQSVFGVVLMTGKTVVSARGTTHHYCVTPSTSEAEYFVIAHGAKAALSSRSLFVCQGAIAISENSLSFARSKHIDVRYHLLRTLVQ